MIHFALPDLKLRAWVRFAAGWLVLLATFPALTAGPLRVVVEAESDAWRSETVSALQQRGGQVVALSGAATDAQLTQADVLVLQSAKFAALPAGRRAALEAFAARGGGLVVVNGAVADGDAAWWKALTGGAWVPGTSRKFNSKMMLYVAQGAHPIIEGASSFDVEDDTLYDLDLAPQIQVLASAFTPKLGGRAAGNRAEQPDRANIFDLQPQMWSYTTEATTSAKGHRAFVLLQGADATLRHPSIKTFLLRAIAWTGGRAAVDEFSAPAEVASLRYPPGGPLTPEATVKQMEVHPGFNVSVAAAEPLVNKLIAVQWDPAGRLWVAETPEYPNGRRPLVSEPWKETSSLIPGVIDRPAHDRICILTDPDANGRFQHKQVFYEGLELVTGFCFYRDGVIAIHNNDIVFLRDTHGTGKADQVVPLFTGFRPGDTHFVANHFIPAPDGWIYASMGGGAEVTSPDGKRNFGRLTSGMFRFQPDGSAIEQISSKGGNSFGAEVTSDMELFFGQATTGNPFQHVAVPEATLARGKIGKGGGAQNVYAGRKVYREHMPERIPLVQIDVVGGFSAACAALVYEGGAWPAEWDRGSFVTEPILNIIHHEALQPDGATFRGEKLRTPEFIYSPDYWFRPIECALGADGAMYILDFYSPVIAHSDSRGPQHGRGSASVRPDREHYFGRIYRVQHQQARVLESPDLTKADAPGLVRALAHPNRTVRFNAQRLLVEQGGPAVVQSLQPVAQAAGTPPPARILALWALHRLHALPGETLIAALRDPDAGVRKNAAFMVEAGAGGAQAAVAASLDDPDPRARLAKLRALTSVPLDAAGAAALVALYPKLNDDWSRSAAVAGALGSPVEVITAAAHSPDQAAAGQLIAGVAARLAEQNQAAPFLTFLPLIAAQPAAQDDLKRRVLEAAARLKSAPAATPECLAALRTLLQSPNRDVAGAALPVATAWDQAGQLKEATQAIVRLELAELAAPALTDERAGQIVASLLGARHLNPEILPAVVRQLTGAKSDVLKRRVVEGLRGTGEPTVGPLLVAAFPQLPSAVQPTAFDALLARTDWSRDLVDALVAKRLDITTLGPANAFRLRTHPNADLARRATALLDELRRPNPDKDQLIAQFLPAVGQPGNIAHGRELFTTTCAVCHKFHGAGADVGPTLEGMGAHGPQGLLVHILDPNRQVEVGYEAWNIETKDGETQSGIVARENDARLVLRMAGRELEIPQANIKSRVNTRRSLMPEGFESLGAEGLRDILAYICEGNTRFRILDLDGAFTADTRQGLYQSQEVRGDTLRFRQFGIQTVDGIPFKIVNPATSPLGGNVIVLQGGGPGSFARQLPRQVEVKVGVAAARLHFLGGVAGWGASGPTPGSPILRVTEHFADGQIETITLHDGVEFADYIAPIEVPGSRLAADVVRGGQVRWFTIPVKRRAVLDTIVLASTGGIAAPTTVAITADLSDAPIPGAPPVGASAKPVPKPEPDLQWGAGTKILVVGGGSSHDFQKWFNTADVGFLKGAGKFSVNYTENPVTATKALAQADVLVSSTNQKDFDTPELRAALGQFAAAGKGIVLLHPAVWYNWPWPEYNRNYVGGGSRSHDRLGEFQVTIAKEHPVTKGVSPTFKVTDELYLMNPDPQGAPIEVLAHTSPALATKKEHPSVWVVQHPQARIVAIALGHDGRVHDLPEYHQLLLNAVNWTAKLTP